MTLITKKQKEYATIPIVPNKPLPLAVALADDTGYKKDGDGLNGEEFVYHDYSEDGLHVSEEVYWKYYYEHPYFNYEWNNGVLEEKTVSTIDTYHAFDWLADLLKEYLKHHPIAKTFSQEIGGRVHLPHKTVVRRPDLWVVLHSNPVPLHGKENSYKGTFDICIEAISKSSEEDIKRDTVRKKKEYALGGVKEYYIDDQFWGYRIKGTPADCVKIALCELLDEKQLKGTLAYYDQFYDIINDPRQVRSNFYEPCPLSHQHLYAK